MPKAAQQFPVVSPVRCVLAALIATAIGAVTWFSIGWRFAVVQVLASTAIVIAGICLVRRHQTKQRGVGKGKFKVLL